MSPGGKPRIPLSIRALFAAYAVVGAILAAHDFGGSGSALWSQVTTVAYFVGSLLLIKLTRLRERLGYAPRTGLAYATIGDALRFVACLVVCAGAGLLIAKFMPPDSELTAVMAVAVIFGCAGFGGFFVGRMVSRLIRWRQ